MCCWQKMTKGPLPYAEKHWLTYGSGYIATPLEEQDTGGKLTVLARIPPEANQLVIRRFTPKTQKIDLHNGARLPAELIESMSDKSTMIVQELAEQMISKDSELELRKEANSAIEAEAKTRAYADLQLKEKIKNEVEAEKEARQHADSGLRAEFENEAASRRMAEIHLKTSIESLLEEEANARKQAGISLEDMIYKSAMEWLDASRKLESLIDDAFEEISTLGRVKQNISPDGETPLVGSDGKISGKYLPSLPGSEMTVDGIQADQSKNIQTRFFIEKGCFDEAQRPLKPGRYIIYGEDLSASIAEVDGHGNEYMVSGDMLPAISNIDERLLSILGKKEEI